MRCSLCFYNTDSHPGRGFHRAFTDGTPLGVFGLVCGTCRSRRFRPDGTPRAFGKPTTRFSDPTPGELAELALEQIRKRKAKDEEATVAIIPFDDSRETLLAVVEAWPEQPGRLIPLERVSWKEEIANHA